VDGFSEETFWEGFLLDEEEGFLETVVDGEAFELAGAFSLSGAGALFSEAGFDGVELTDLFEEPATEFGFVVVGFVEFSADVCPAADEFDLCLAS